MPKIYTFGQPRNYDGIAFEGIRRVIDPEFEILHDTLSDCYYNFWKNSNSKPFTVGNKTYDVQATPQESKALFDKLHSLIPLLHTYKLYLANELLPQNKKYLRLEQDRYVKNDKNEVIEDKLQTIISQINALKSEGIEIPIDLTIKSKERTNILALL